MVFDLFSEMFSYQNRKIMKQLIFGSLLLYAVSGFAQQPILVTINGGNLYSLNLTNCTSIFVGSTGYGFGDIAFTPDGRLWGITAGELYQIDPTTAVATLIGLTGAGGISLVGLNDSILLTEYQMKLYAINNTNAYTHLIGDIGYQATGDLTWYDHDLYMSAAGQLIKITLNSTNTAVVSAGPVNPDHPIPSCEGMVTAAFPGAYNALVGFSNNKVYKICHLDGSAELLCTSIVPQGIPGGASMRLAVQQPEPATCVVPSSVSSLVQQSQVEIMPNPVSREGLLHIKLGTGIQSQVAFRLINLQGQVVISETGPVTGNSITINLKNLGLSGGAFVVEVSGASLHSRTLVLLE
jgi:hypothetical protein